MDVACKYHLFDLPVEIAERALAIHGPPRCKCGRLPDVALIMRDPSRDKPDGTFGISTVGACNKHAAHLRQTIAEVAAASGVTTLPPVVRPA